jgi:iron complex outermembrane receptor protein
VTTTFNWVGSFSALDPSVEVNECAGVSGVSGRAYFFGKDTPPQYCTNKSFTSTDLNMTYQATKNLSFKLSVLNLLDKAPPISVSTYGNSSNLTAYNATLHQAGAVGRYFSVGAAYSF